MKSGRVVRLTKRSVDAAVPEAKLFRLWDTDLKGFGLRVTAAGVKSYIVAYRPNGGGRSVAQQEYTIARHGIITPDQARAEAADILAAVRSGGDPQVVKAAKRTELTVSQLCDLYLLEGTATKKASTLKTDKVRIERHIKPLLGRRLVSSVTDADIERFLRDVAVGRTAVKRRPSRLEAAGSAETARRRTDPVARGGKGTATRTTGLLGAIFTFAIKRKMISANPVHGVERFRDGESQRYLSAKEIIRLGEVLSGFGPESTGASIIRILLLTGARKGEIESLMWSSVDQDRGCLRLVDSKTGAKILPIGQAAMDELVRLPRIAGSQFVFPSATDLQKHFVGTPKVWARVRREAGLDSVRLHDLRHSFASVAAAGGQSLPLIGRLLGHKDVKTTAQYAHLADDPVRRAADETASALKSALG